MLTLCRIGLRAPRAESLPRRRCRREALGGDMLEGRLSLSTLKQGVTQLRDVKTILMDLGSIKK
jgi:hypothetical protein